jgi:hypothetical protein
MSDFDISVKNFKSIEMYVSRYIYKKYFENGELDNDKLYKYSSKVLNKDDFKEYLDTIFVKQRPRLITQDDIIEKEINDINLADAKYDDLQETTKTQLTSETRFPRSETKSYPDTMRCNFIIKRKNKYKRCGNKVFSNDIEYCRKHATQSNIYYDKYDELLDKI